MVRLSWGQLIALWSFVLICMGLEKRTRTKAMEVVACFTLILFSGLRHGYIDTRAYRQGFLNLDVSQVFSSTFLYDADSKDKGFSVLSSIIKLFTDNAQVFLFIFALLTVGLLFFGLIKRTENKMMAVFLFIMTGCFLDTMNGMRQAFVQAVMFYFGTDLILNKKTLKYIVLVLLLSTVHASVLVFIPIYFVVSVKPWSKQTIFLSFAVVVIYVFFNTGFGQMIADLLEETSYGYDYGQMLISGNTSTNAIRVIVAGAPLILSWINRSNAPNDNKIYRIAFNMSVLNFFTWLFSTKVLYFYRLAVYFMPFMILLMCYEVALLRANNRKVVTFSIYALYLIWHVYSLSVTGDAFFVGYFKY